MRSFLASRIIGIQKPCCNQDDGFYALKDISFEVKEGDALGIIGPNGAGKSTILKLLAHTIEPTSGRIITNGRISALIELGAGFHPELTGRENIYLYGSIMGLKRKEINGRFNSIVSFAELEQFIDTPIKHYSSGMYARLGFAVAIHVDPDILLIDEVLSVGDMNFRKKCYEKLHAILSVGHTTIIFVSHDIYRVQALCKKTIFVDKGIIRKTGYTPEVIAYYCSEMNKAMLLKEPKTDEKRWGTGEIKITDVYLSNADGEKTDTFERGGSFIITMNYHAHKKIINPDFRFIVQTTDGIEVLCISSANSGNLLDFIEGSGIAKCCLESVPLNQNAYCITVGISNLDGQIDYDTWYNAARFVITSSRLREGYHLPANDCSLIHWPSKIVYHPAHG